MSTSTHTPQSKYSSNNTIKTVAARELSVLLRSKGIIISVLLTLLVTVGAVIAASFFMDQDEDQPTLVVSGMDTQTLYSVNESFMQEGNEGATEGAGPIAGMGFGGTDGIAIEDADTGDAAEQAVRDGADAALVATGEGSDVKYELVSDGTADPSIVAVVGAALSANAQNTALESLNVNPQEFADAMPPSTYDTVDISQEDSGEANIGAVVTVLIAVGLMSFFIMLFAGSIGSRVTEEKSSRVVEIILATVRPLDFLGGKLIANVILGTVSSLLILGSGAAAITATGLLKDFPLDMAVLPLMLLSFIIGLLFFGSLYAAAGSMVSRTEDLQSTQAPIMLLVMGMIYAPMFGWSMLDSTVMQVLAWVPPFSLTVAPVQMAGGNMSLPMVLASFAVALVTTLLVMLFVSKIYRNAILHNGSKLTWVKAIKGA